MTLYADNFGKEPMMKEMLAQIQNGDNLSASQLLQAAMNLFMLAERNLHLQKAPDNKANGFFDRELGTSLGTIDLKVPRDRQGNFRPSILPSPYQRDLEEREHIIKSLFINGYSPNMIKRSLNELNLHYNPEELAKLKQEYAEVYQKWQSRQLPHDMMALFADVYHCETCIHNKVRKSALYVIVGIDFEAKKELVGLYLYEGSETKGFWLQTLNQLIERGLKRTLMVISDDFPGLKDAVNTLFPEALHQLCFIHMQRNVHRNMGTADSKVFNQSLKQIRLMSDPECCQKEFTQLCEKYQKSYPSFVRGLLDDTKNYFAFKYLPSDIQKHFYTTNIVESVNSMLEKIRGKMGGFFQSQEALCINAFITIDSLRQRKWSHGVPMIKANLYQLRQLFAQKYGEGPKLN